jgi:hypothetical protein
MFILAEDGQSYARLQFGVGPGGSLRIPVVVDYSRPFLGSDFGTWEQEYIDHVEEIEPPWAGRQSPAFRQVSGFDLFEEGEDPFSPQGDRAFGIFEEEEAWKDFFDEVEATHGR